MSLFFFNSVQISQIGIDIFRQRTACIYCNVCPLDNHVTTSAVHSLVKIRKHLQKAQSIKDIDKEKFQPRLIYQKKRHSHKV